MRIRVDGLALDTQGGHIRADLTKLRHLCRRLLDNIEGHDHLFVKTV